MDFAILDFIQSNLRCDFLDVLMPLITKLGSGGVIWILLTIVFLAYPKTRRIGTAMAFGLAIEAVLCNGILKPMVARVRPYDVNTAIKLLIEKPGDYSFPSGHTGAAFATVSALILARKQLENTKVRRVICIVASVIAVLIAFSRLYLYVHYPSDVLAGAVIGIAAGWCGYWYEKVSYEKNAKKIAAQKSKPKKNTKKKNYNWRK